MASNDTMKTLYIHNMTCVNCENRIERALHNIPGVNRVKASYSAGTVNLTYNSNEIQLADIIQIIEGKDYHVVIEKTGTNTDTKTRIETDENTKDTTDYTNIVIGAIILITLYIIFKRFGFTNRIYAFPMARAGMGYGMLFVIGLLTSVHCIAMCGGICLSQCAKTAVDAGDNKTNFSVTSTSLMYNIGRVLSYTVIGGLVGALGSVVSFTGIMTGIVQLLAGLFMIIMGLNMLNLFPWLRKLNPRMPKIFTKGIYTRSRNTSPFYIGILNGLMPCGPLQAMQLYALSTGSPIKGAISMFLFSIGTVPLMFTFGALSSLLNKKFTKKMMTVSAVLVMVLGFVMFNRGASLSGILLPFLSSTSQSESITVATMEDGVQTVTTNLSSGSYEPIMVRKGIPVRWIVKAEKSTLNGCNNSIIIPKYNIQKDLEVGENMIEFTPTNSGTIPYSCWMGMIRSTITVED